nr:hypothetical protein KPHV_40710 [Kitasatospora purpeofusca]
MAKAKTFTVEFKVTLTDGRRCTPEEIAEALSLEFDGMELEVQSEKSDDPSSYCLDVVHALSN